jgi:hypothetical protein
MAKQWLAVDEYGQQIRLAGPPRKALLDYLGRKHAQRIFRDKKDGSMVHVGYHIAGSWWTLYELIPMENPY